MATSNYIDRDPSCVFSTDADDNVVLTVANLRTSGTSQQTYYGLYFSGLTTGPSARSSDGDENDSQGTYATTYVGTSAKETIASNKYIFAYVEKTDGVTLVGSPS